jgi:hypothetical protein
MCPVSGQAHGRPLCPWRAGLLAQGRCRAAGCGRGQHRRSALRRGWNPGAAPVTSGAECAAARRGLGVYVLGAMDSADRAELEQHLASCLRCREELAGLAGLPALLRKVPVAQAVILCSEAGGEDGAAAPAPGQLLGMVLYRVARRRRHRRWRLAAAAAVLLAATATGWGLRAWQPVAQPAVPAGSRWAAAGEFNSATGVGATVRYTARAWGTQLEVHVTGIPSGITCRFWVTTSHGQDIAAGGWAIAAGQQHTWYPASTPVPVSGLRSFEVTSAGKTLATVLAHRRPPRHAPTRSR